MKNPNGMAADKWSAWWVALVAMIFAYGRVVSLPSIAIVALSVGDVSSKFRTSRLDDNDLQHGRHSAIGHGPIQTYR